MIKKIVLDIQSNIHAHTMERMLMQEPDDCRVVISESPDSTAEWCKTHRPDVLLMEVKMFSPWMFSERIFCEEYLSGGQNPYRVQVISPLKPKTAASVDELNTVL